MSIINRTWGIAWAIALRSGKYQQGRGKLRNTDSHCCLGVLCDIVDPAGWVLDSHDSNDAMPGEAVRRITDLGMNTPWAFAAFNDALFWSFEMIAAFIDDDPSDAKTSAYWQIACNVASMKSNGKERPSIIVSF